MLFSLRLTFKTVSRLFSFRCQVPKISAVLPRSEYLRYVDVNKRSSERKKIQYKIMRNTVTVLLFELVGKTKQNKTKQNNVMKLYLFK